jgi:hypothetical protein
MTSPTVVELRPRLEPVCRDTFADDLTEPHPARRARMSTGAFAGRAAASPGTPHRPLHHTGARADWASLRASPQP